MDRTDFNRLIADKTSDAVFCRVLKLEVPRQSIPFLTPSFPVLYELFDLICVIKSDGMTDRTGFSKLGFYLAVS